jgi:DNA repair protein RecN (Recombination protein N)
MPLARLEIVVEKDRPGPQGNDRTEFLFAPNPGEGLASLARIASGGEISRVMLAVKVILADADDTGILVFDEVDTGIGGEAIVAVAENLSRLGQSKQVFCVSHSPQLASFADVHFRIEKHFDGSRTTTRVTLLDDEQRREEIARMLGGQGNIEGVKTQAAQMIRSAQAIRRGRRPGGEN